MAGAYCKFCDRRCFVLRMIPDGPEKGWTGHLATCPQGMAHDLKITGYTHLTAVNLVTDPEAAERIAAEVRDADPARALGRKRFAELTEMSEDPEWLGI